MADCKICAKQDDCPFAISSDIICSSYKQRSMSNADRIRAMSDEEMATKLYLFACVHALDSEVKCKDNGCKNCWLDWLRSPAEVKSADRSN